MFERLAWQLQLLLQCVWLAGAQLAAGVAPMNAWEVGVELRKRADSGRIAQKAQQTERGCNQCAAADWPALVAVCTQERMLMSIGSLGLCGPGHVPFFASAQAVDNGQCAQGNSEAQRLASNIEAF